MTKVKSIILINKTLWFMIQVFNFSIHYKVAWQFLILYLGYDNLSANLSRQIKCCCTIWKTPYFHTLNRDSGCQAKLRNCYLSIATVHTAPFWFLVKIFVKYYFMWFKTVIKLRFSPNLVIIEAEGSIILHSAIAYLHKRDFFIF